MVIPVRTPLVIAVAVCLLAVGCSAGRSVTASGSRDGLALDMTVRATAGSLIAQVAVRNTRATPVHLDADQCGRVTEVVLARTTFQPEGATEGGSLGAVKRLVLAQQSRYQDPNRFAPRLVTGGPDVPDCVRPSRPIAIASGGSIEERWELPFDLALGLAEVGSADTVVRAEAVESVTEDKLGLLDIVPTGEAETARQGRSVVVEAAAATVLDRAPTRPITGPSLGQRFDRMVENEAVREFISGQPADSWREAMILPAGSAALEFRAVTTGFERALVVDLADDGAVVGDPSVPGPDDRAHALERRSATLPPGIVVIPEADAPLLTEDVLAGDLWLPTGRVVADGALVGEATPLPDSATPGAYPVFVSVGRQPGSPFDQVAFASLVVSDAPTVRWIARSTVAVDGGTAGFTSAEGSDLLGRVIKGTASGSIDRAFDALTAHDGLIATVPLGDGLDLALFTTGYGDGGYGVYVGLDADARPTRYVIDFAIVHLAWP